jgi:F0F1-type ATP synthase assembly protein I
MFTDSAAGIRPIDGIVFIIIQFVSGILAILVWKYYIKKCARC